MKDKVTIITGASSGIGKAMAFEAAQRGARLVLAARNLNSLNAILTQLKAKDVEAIAIKTDVSKEEDCKKLINEAVNHFGKIDILINNAGISMRSLFKDVDINVIRRLMDVNFWGTVYCSKYALPYLLKTKGSIVGVISIAGHVGLPGRSGYSASKFAIRGFLDTLRTENLKTGLHVLVAAPGFTASNIRKVALDANGSGQGETPRDESKMMSAEEAAVRILNAVRKRKKSLILTFTEGKLTVFLNKFFPAFISKQAYQHLAKEPDSPFK
jgi:short-subunit dehydrogenase